MSPISFAAQGPMALPVVSGLVTLDPGTKGANVVLSNGNLAAAKAASGIEFAYSTTTHSSGKYYFEWHQDASSGGAFERQYGIINTALSASAVVLDENGDIYVNSALQINLGTLTGATQYGACAVDIGAQKIWWLSSPLWGGNWNNDTIINQNPATTTGGFNIAAISPGSGIYVAIGVSNTAQITVNFGASGYHYTPPAGFSNW